MRCWLTMCALALALLLPVSISSATLSPRVVTVPPFSLRLPQVASWYHLPGQTTASGKLYGGLTAAHRTLPMGSKRTLCREDRPRVCVEVTVVDRGPFVAGRDWDLSRAAARRLGMIRQGVIGITMRSE